MSKKDVTVLVVDDEDDFREIFSHVVSRMGYSALLAANSAEALALVQQRRSVSPVDVAIIDYQLPSMNGLQLFASLKKIDPLLQALFITGYGSLPGSTEAAELGVYDCIAKPLDLPHLERVLARLAATRQMALENLRLHTRLKQLDNDRNIIGQTPQMQELFDDLSRLAHSDRPIVIKGEVGTGKSLLARSIHIASPRRSQPFLTLDCLALREDQLEKKIFGEEHTAIRSAPAQGLWQMARNGTLFIRTANMLPAAVIDRLKQEFAETARHPDASGKAPLVIFSVIEKSFSDAPQEAAAWVEHHFTQVHMPSLRERRDDIPLLVQHFLKMMSTKERRLDRVAPQAMQVMQQYSWPGNVRELRNTVKRAFEVGHTHRLSLTDLPMYIIEATEKAISRSESMRSLHAIEKKAILETLRLVRGDKARAAEILRIDRSTLYRKLKRYGLH
jgi:DNA-binding NtrC family response regulator